MSTRARTGSAARRGGARGGKIKAVFWFNALLAVVMGGWFALQPAARQAEVTKLLGNYFEKNKRVELLDVAQDLYRFYYSDDFVATIAAGDHTHVYGGVPLIRGFTHPIRMLANTGYVAGYCDAWEDPAWVAYRVVDLETLPEPAARPEHFETDLRTAARVSPADYTNSGYDRGHLAPNYVIATRYGEAAQRETFLMSNIVPQRHALNAGLWKQMEMKLATSYPARFGEVWVLTGPVFGTRPARLPNGTAIPEAFFMIMVDESAGRVRAQALVFPQETPPGAQAEQFVVSIDEVERRTGLDFLHELEDGAEDALEAKRVQAVW